MFHSLTIVGNLGRDPEMRYTQTGQAVTSFSVAASRSYTRSDGEKVKETIWFRVSAWGKLAEVCSQYLHKGSKVLIVGELKGTENGEPRVWEDNSGNARASFEVTAQTVRFLSSRGEGEAEAVDNGVAEEDIPF